MRRWSAAPGWSGGGGWDEEVGSVARRQRLRSDPAVVDILEAYTLSPGIESKDPFDVPGHRHQAPFAADLVEPAQQELAKAQNRFDDAEHRLRRVFSPGVELLAFGRGQAVGHGFE